MFIVGKILKPQGIHGEVKIEVITSFPEHFNDLKTLYIEIDQNWRECPVETVRRAGRHVFIKFVNIRTFEEAAVLRNKLLYIQKKDLSSLSADEYYIHDLIGLKVFDEQNVLRGEIVDVESYSANDVYVLRAPNGESLLVPAIKDVVREVNINEKTMRIHVPDGLFD